MLFIDRISVFALNKTLVTHRWTVYVTEAFESFKSMKIGKSGTDSNFIYKDIMIRSSQEIRIINNSTLSAMSLGEEKTV